MTVIREPYVMVAASTDISRRTVLVGMGFGAIAAALAASGWSVRTAAQDATPASDAQPMEELNAIVVLYNQPDDPVAFQDQLVNEYLPLVHELPDIREFIVQRGLITTEGIPGDIYQIGTFLWESQAALEAALATDAGVAAVAGTANLATGGFAAYWAHVEYLPVHAGTGSPEASPPA